MKHSAHPVSLVHPVHPCFWPILRTTSSVAHATRSPARRLIPYTMIVPPMPPRYAYWTIIVDNAPTAFRSGSKEELLPTFNRLKEKHASAVMMWWQNGKLWPSRLDAQEMMRARGEMGRRNDSRQAGRPPFRDRERKPTRERSAWTPRGEPSAPPPARN